MFDNLQIIAISLAKKKYNIKNIKKTDFEKKKECIGILHLIELNNSKLKNIEKSSDFETKFDYMKGFEEKAFEILKQAKEIMKKYNIENQVNVFDVKRQEEIEKIIQVEYKATEQS